MSLTCCVVCIVSLCFSYLLSPLPYPFIPSVPVKGQFFLPTVAKCLLTEFNCSQFSLVYTQLIHNNSPLKVPWKSIHCWADLVNYKNKFEPN